MSTGAKTVEKRKHRLLQLWEEAAIISNSRVAVIAESSSSGCQAIRLR